MFIIEKYIRDLAETNEPRRLENTNNLKHEIFDIESISGFRIAVYLTLTVLG